MTGCEVLARTSARIPSSPAPPRPELPKRIVDSGGPVDARDDLPGRYAARGGKTVTVNAEGKFNHTGNAVGLADGPVIGEGLRIAAGRFHPAIEVILADDAEVDGPHRPGVLL